jgi:hypothetical protein
LPRRRTISAVTAIIPIIANCFELMDSLPATDHRGPRFGLGNQYGVQHLNVLYEGNSAADVSRHVGSCIFTPIPAPIATQFPLHPISRANGKPLKKKASAAPSVNRGSESLKSATDANLG